MKVLIAGAAGQVGSALAANAPEPIAVLALPRAALDITDAASVAVAVDRWRPDIIVNAAAYTNVEAAEANAAEAFRINRDAPGILASVAAERGLGLVHISTDFVFDGRASRPYAPDHPAAPINVYGVSKAAGEDAVRAALPDALIVRTAWLYALHGSNFVLTMLRLLAERSEVGVVADQVGTPTYAVNLARAIWALALPRKSGTYHFTDAGVASWYDFAAAIQEEALSLGLLTRRAAIRPIRTEDYPTAARRPAYSLLDKTSTYAALEGPIVHWRSSLRAALTELSARHG